MGSNSRQKTRRDMLKAEGLFTRRDFFLHPDDVPHMRSHELGLRAIRLKLHADDPGDIETAFLRFYPPKATLDEQSASNLGLSIYRPGDPCKCGRKGWRRIETDVCLICEEIVNET